MKTTSRPPLSVIIPILNEEESLGELHSRLGLCLPPDAEIIFVDDGSTDGTTGVLEGIASRDPRVQAYRFRRNFGKSTALAAGFRRARGDLVATMDADLQEDPSEIQRLAGKISAGYDLVVGWRRKRRDPWGKVMGSRIFNACVSLIGGTRFRDINCGLKVMRREVLEDISLAGGFHRFLPLLAHWKGYRVAEVEVGHQPRRHGESRYGGDRIREGVLDLLAVMFLVRFEGRPSRYFAAVGILLGLLGFVISSYLAGLRILTGSIQERFPLLALGLVLLVVGVQLFSLGLFGELVAHHFRSRRSFEPALWALRSGGSDVTPPDRQADAQAEGQPPPCDGEARAAEENPGGAP